jgi:anhydro-N-acetylmuramic acid kinase
MQIGDVSVIACRTGCPVIGEFRNADMAMGGQGAPLVPFADFALFASETENRAIQNIGGIANVTWLPAGRDTASIVAFDTGPGNMALDAIARAITDGRLQYDADGAMAGRGHVDRRLLASWLEHPYFAARPPKSTGHEEFGEPYARRLMESAAQSECSSDDLMATATALTAESIAESYRRWLLPLGSVDLVIVGGGGAHNATLMSMIATALGLPRITTHEALGVPDDAKEAIAFALLGWETLRGRPANVPSATGASGPAVLGKIALPPSCGLRPLIDIGAD